MSARERDAPSGGAGEVGREGPEAAGGASPLAIVLSGGGARAAYQVGLLRCLARLRPELSFDIITGVSAGAINAAFLASHPGALPDASRQLSQLWETLTPERIFRAGAGSLLRQMAGWGVRLTTGRTLGKRERGLVDTTPLKQLLHRAMPTNGDELVGIAENLDRGRLSSVALTTLDYATGRTITWVQGCDIDSWERANRGSVKTRLTVDHVLASAALPLLFPAVHVGGSWHGDGGVRLAAPLSPALHLGAHRVLVISTRYGRSTEEAQAPVTRGYPPPAQILGNLLNAIFLDVVDQDVRRVETINALLDRLEAHERGDLRRVEVLTLRPSEDLGRLASRYEPQLPGAFRSLTRNLGTRETRSPDFLSLLMFQPDYLKRLIRMGEADAEAQRDEISALLDGSSA